MEKISLVIIHNVIESKLFFTDGTGESEQCDR